MSEQLLNNFIQSQNTVNMQLSAAAARIEQQLADNSRRLFGGEGQKGAITYLHDEHEELKEKHAEATKAIGERVGALELWKSGTLKWVAGALFVLTAEASAVGFYFHNVATAVKALAVPGHP